MKTDFFASDKMYLVALHRAMGLTFRRFERLAHFFEHDWHAAWHGSKDDFLEAGIDARGVEKFLEQRKHVSPEKEMEMLASCQANIFVYGETGFPLSLLHVHNPPALLFVRGILKEEDFPAISVVGSRKLSSYGRKSIEQIVGAIANQHITIVSGLALGADMFAHKIAIKQGTRTLCVLGNGIDHIYPESHERFANKLLREENGAIISEYLPGVQARPEHFPVRNRIVAGLSRATIVIEAAIKSGSLITAELALEQGKEVFAVPGEIFAPQSKGTNHIISSGATPALSGKQILTVLGMYRTASTTKKISLPTTGIEGEILKAFGDEQKLHLDQLIRRAPFDGSVVSANLSIMEIRGFVRNVGNQVYARNV